ncbi:PfkB family carbohydrate kinase [Desulfovibrio sp. UCD-KL4C]|uniref:PfkB family carbohydrate kinase n=1 Tax=Desulfovibrio sp. UCD-KL4C TaxID=2578120 RepID=UPI0025BAE4E0|nr:PfkB family carbohydrate kinase [Desulfovibrio sp. UCD-KL4C]
MAEFLVAGLGEILWDVLNDSEEIGGAPINFAYHAGALGADSIAISTIGSDERGRRSIEELQARELNLEAVSIDPDHATGFVEAKIDKHGVAHYMFPDNIAWDHLTLNDKAMNLAPKIHAVCYGTLAQRNKKARNSIYAFLDAAPKAMKVYDMNLRQHFYSKEIISKSLEKADVLKLNDDEIQIVASMFDLKGTENQMLEILHNKFNLNCSILTRGSKGSLIIGYGQEIESDGIVLDILENTIGAGDSFTAATILGLLLEHSLSDISKHANKLAAYVCSCKGAMPPIPEEFKLIK